MIEFDVDMGYLIEAGELDCVILNDENGEYESMKFTSELGGGTCEFVECGICKFYHADIQLCEYGIPPCSKFERKVVSE